MTVPECPTTRKQRYPTRRAVAERLHAMFVMGGVVPPDVPYSYKQCDDCGGWHYWSRIEREQGVERERRTAG